MTLRETGKVQHSDLSTGREGRLKGMKREEREEVMEDVASHVANASVERTHVSDGTAGHCACLHTCGAFLTNCGNCLCCGAHALGEAHCYSARGTSGNWMPPGPLPVYAGWH